MSWITKSMYRTEFSGTSKKEKEKVYTLDQIKIWLKWATFTGSDIQKDLLDILSEEKLDKANKK